jgi:hypothetical protein
MINTIKKIKRNKMNKISDEGGDNFRGSMTLPLQKKPLTPTRNQGFYCFPACTVTLLYWD